MAKRSRLSISVKLILTSTLLILLLVAGFGVLNVLNVRDVYDAAAREKIANFVEALTHRGETTTQVFAQAMLPNLINNADADIKLIVDKTANQDPDLKLIYILSRDKRVVAYCDIERTEGRICNAGPYERAAGKAGLPAMSDPSWQRIEEVWREQVAAGKADALVDVEYTRDGKRMQLFAYPVMSGGEVPTPQAALADEPGENRQGYVALGYELAPIDRFIAESQRNKAAAEKALVWRTGLIGVLFVLIGTVLTIFQGLRISKPLQLLAWKADQIARGDFRARADIRSRDEIGALAENFNFMADQLVVLLAQARAKATLEKELEVARTIQQKLVPSDDQVQIGDFSFAGAFQPASQCGGDWWSYYMLRDGKVLVIIGDVTGHGVPAAMITATAKSACDVARAIYGDDVGVTRVLEVMNYAIYQSAQRNFVMTCFASIIDLNNRTITYANAGHNFPYLYRVGPDGEGDFSALTVRGNRLGDLREAQYEARTTPLSSGDVLFWYTDGLIECESTTGEEYSEKRLRAALRRVAGRSVTEIRNGVAEDAQRFYGSMPRKDDITLIVGRVA